MRILETPESFLFWLEQRNYCRYLLSSLHFLILLIFFPYMGRVSYCEKEEGIPWFCKFLEIRVWGKLWCGESMHRKTYSHVWIYCNQHTQVLSPIDCWPSCVATLWEKHHLSEKKLFTSLSRESSSTGKSRLDFKVRMFSSQTTSCLKNRERNGFFF